MATTVLHLVRHAEPELTGEDPGLTDTGRAQAAKVAEALRESEPSEVLHGTRLRSVETAAILASTLHMEPTESVLAEDLTPIPSDWATVPKRYHAFLRGVPRSEQDLGGERLDAAFDEIAERGGDDRTILMVTHNFVIGWFVRRTLDAPWSRWIGLNQDHASVTTIEWADATEPRLLRMNGAGFL